DVTRVKRTWAPLKVTSSARFSRICFGITSSTSGWRGHTLSSRGVGMLTMACFTAGSSAKHRLLALRHNPAHRVRADMHRLPIAPRGDSGIVRRVMDLLVAPEERARCVHRHHLVVALLGVAPLVGCNTKQYSTEQTTVRSGCAKIFRTSTFSVPAID